MKSDVSLKRIWTLIVLFAVVTPVSLAMIWYARTIYTTQLNSALTIQRQANETLRNHIESEIKRFDTLLRAKSRLISVLMERGTDPRDILKINSFLRAMIEREPSLREAMIFSKNGNVVTAIDPGLGVMGDKLLSPGKLNRLATHWGLSRKIEHPEIIVPSTGKRYISSIRKHENFFAFHIAMPIGNPVKAVLIAKLDAGRLIPKTWPRDRRIGDGRIRDYLLDRRGVLITKIEGSAFKPGDLMTNLRIVRSSLMNRKWPEDISYTGISNQTVFGTITQIPSLNWTLVSEISSSHITGPIWMSLFKVIGITLFGILLFVVSILRLAKRTLIPIQQTCDALYKVAQGEYNFILEKSGIRELDEMTTGFHSMASARQEAENALRDSEEDLAVTLQSIGDAVITTDTNGYITRMNPIAENLTGWPLNEAKGELLRNVMYIQDAFTGEPVENPVEKVLASGEIIYMSNHTTLMARNNHSYQISDSAAPIRDKEGNILGVVLVFNDVSDQYRLRQAVVKSRNDLQAILDHSPTVIYAKDLEGKYIFVNERFADLFMPGNEDIVGRTDYEIFPAEVADKFVSMDKEVIAAGRAIESEEIAPHDDGNHIYLSIKFPLYNNEGTIYAICGILTDITERKKVEEMLRQSQKMEVLGRLTGGVAHDFNNMLSVIIGYSEILQSMLHDQPKLSNYAQEIHRAGERGAKLTNRLLDFSRHKSTDAEAIDINVVLRIQEHMLKKSLTARIELQLDLGDDLWPVYLDKSDFENAVMNISINAMHAMETGGHLTIRTNNEVIDEKNARYLGVKSGKYVLLNMIDTGSGMDLSVQEKIFEPFFSTKNEKGTGLGLSQVYGFVERSGGAIKVYSELNRGTRLSLYFPHLDQHHEEGVFENTDHAIDLIGTESILIVDDEPALLELSSEIITEKGYHVICAASAREALDILANESVDLLLSDIIMPEMDGYQLAAVVQREYPDIKIQLVSGFNDEHHADLVDEDLFRNLLQKPINSQTLLQRLRELLD